MRKLVITQNCTADGAVEMLGEWFDPADQSDDSGLADLMQAHQDACDAVLLGRVTFEDFRGFWPNQTDDTTGISDYLNATQKYVVSSTITDPGWENSTVLSGDPVEQVRDLKRAAGGDIELTGSITLAHALLSAELVDEIRLFAYPVVQGAGRGLFPDGCELSLQLLESRRFDEVVYTSYAVAPAVV